MKRGRREPRVERLGAEVQWQLNPGRMDIERRQRARVIQYDSYLGIEMEDGTREARHRLRRRFDDPIAVHAEMHMKDAAVIETNELMLPPPLDRTHARTGERTQRSAWEASSQRRVQYARAQQRPAFDRHAKASGSTLDFRKLGHQLSR